MRTPMKPEELQRNMLSSYFTLRAGIVLLSAALPMILYFYSWAVQGGLTEHSMSAFYGAYDGRTRNVFVGILWAVGSFLILYKGFGTAEDWALNLAGGFAVLTAVTPCNCWSGGTAAPSPLHVVFAVMFFACMAFVCWFCANDTITLLPDDATRTKFSRAYRIIGFFLVASPLAALAVSFIVQSYVSRTFFIEWFGVWVFAAYWLTKSAEFHITSAEKRAVQGTLRKVSGVGVVSVD
jgi:hypothetical protein